MVRSKNCQAGWRAGKLAVLIASSAIPSGCRRAETGDDKETWPPHSKSSRRFGSSPIPSKGDTSAKLTEPVGPCDHRTCRPVTRERVPRSLGTSIYYLLTPETFSELHRLPTEEIFHVYLGGPVRMLQLFAGGMGRELLMGLTSWEGKSPRSSCQPASGRARCSSQALNSLFWGRRWLPGSTMPTTSKAGEPNCLPIILPTRP